MMKTDIPATFTEAFPTTAVKGQAPGQALGALFVPQPQTIEETGLDFSMILDLVVKAVYFAGRPAARSRSSMRCWRS